MTTENQQTIALDVMGSDNGLEEIVAGGVDAARRLGDTAQIVMVGKRDRIESCLARLEDRPSNISAHDAESEVPMTMSATEALRIKDSSIATALRLVKNGEADAFVSPGNTGAVMATALFTLGRIEGVARPAIASVFPTSTGRPTVVLDVGANADCKPQHLSQFAVMGSVYSSVIFNLDAPRVGLISIGEERSKGNDLIIESRKLLTDSRINFVGNIEGRDIMCGTIDVAVTDGFTGNILLKFAESIMPLLVKSVQRQVQTNIFSRIGAMLLLPFLRRMRNSFDYAESGGAPLLGLNGTVIICHGGSSAKAIRNAVLVAYEMSSKKVKDRIYEELVTNHFGQNNGLKSQSQDSRNGVVCATPAHDQR